MKDIGHEYLRFGIRLRVFACVFDPIAEKSAGGGQDSATEHKKNLLG